MSRGSGSAGTADLEVRGADITLDHQTHRAGGVCGQ